MYTLQLTQLRMFSERQSFCVASVADKSVSLFVGRDFLT